RIAFYISGHGFGHGARQVELIGTLLAEQPDLQAIVKTSLKPSMFDPVAGDRVVVQRLDTDSGLTQLDSLHIDEEDSARRAARFNSTFDQRVAEEAAQLDATGVNLVVGDIPPLAFAAAARARVPSLAIANFTWDWIYGAYPAFERIAPEVQTTIRAAYAQA